MDLRLAYDDIIRDANNVTVDTMCEYNVSADLLRSRALAMARRGYRFTPQTLEALEYYLRGYGVMLAGPVGTGKTLFFDLVDSVAIKRVSMLYLVSLKFEDVSSLVYGLMTSPLLIDDIGNEPAFNNYGVRMDIFPWLLERRMMSPQVTHFTTNLTGDQLLERYGARVVDRLKEMCKAVRLTGKSQRVAKPNQLMVELSSRPWTLCHERCSRFVNGVCTAGISYPPDSGDAPRAPETCSAYIKRGGE